MKCSGQYSNVTVQYTIKAPPSLGVSHVYIVAVKVFHPAASVSLSSVMLFVIEIDLWNPGQRAMEKCGEMLHRRWEESFLMASLQYCKLLVNYSLGIAMHRDAFVSFFIELTNNNNNNTHNNAMLMHHGGFQLLYCNSIITPNTEIRGLRLLAYQASAALSR